MPIGGIAQNWGLGKKKGMFEEREPFSSELEYFKANPHVGGMAAEDGKIVMNPFSPLKPQEKDAVRLNESARLYMRQKGAPKFALTPEQMNLLSGTDYKNASPEDQASTIAARILSGDPSAGTPTREQMMYVDSLRKALGLGKNK